MRPYHFEGRSLKSYLLRKFLPLMLLGILMVTGWTIAGSWLSAKIGGTQWVSNDTDHLEVELEEIDEEAQLAKNMASEWLAKGRVPPVISEKYFVYRISPDKRVELVSGVRSEAGVPENTVHELARIRSIGLYGLDGKLVYAIPIAPFETKSKNHFVLVRRIGNGFVDRLSSSLSAEVMLLMQTPSQNVLASSWKNQRGERIFPAINEDVWRELDALRGTNTFTGMGTYRIPKYRGLRAHRLENAVSRGQDEVDVFFSFKTIYDENANRLGYIAVMLPQDVLFAGVKKGIWMALLCAFAVSCLITWLIVRTAAHFTEPLTKLAQETDDLAHDLFEKQARYGIAQTEVPRASANEIETLSMGIDLLKFELAKANKIEKLIGVERASAQSASRLAALGEMSASIAHELNNPIAIIHAISDEMQEKATKGELPTEEVKRRSVLIKDTAKRVGSIIHALLRVSRDAANDPMDSYSLKALFDDALLLIGDQVQKQKIQLSVDIPRDMRILCRGTQISQVVLNLLNNSIDAVEHSDPKWIHVDARAIGSTLRISVTDSGPGIAEKIKSRFMEPFVTTKAVGKGTGLGLSVSRRIVLEHKGRIHLDETYKHTKFIIELPIHGPAPHEAALDV